MTISIIIPAHNEEAIIEATLGALLEGLDTESFEIFVVCNGCNDQTARKATAVSSKIQVIEITEASKTAALNEGDRSAEGFPRVYMDADIHFSAQAVLRLVSFIHEHDVPAAAPAATMALEQSSWAVKAYYRTWFSLPYVKSGMVGCGVFALSKRGRERFGKFPDLIADDGYVRSHFSDQERPVVPGCEVVVTAPRVLNGLIKIKTRSRLGGKQLSERHPELASNTLNNPRGNALLKLCLRPSLWASIPVYLYVVLLSTWRSRKQFRQRAFHTWERDDTSRATISQSQ